MLAGITLHSVSPYNKSGAAESGVEDKHPTSIQNV